MIPMWFISFGSDIYVFICMGFVLVDLFDEWVYGFYIGGYLRYVMVKIWGFWLSNVKYMVNKIFIVY